MGTPRSPTGPVRAKANFAYTRSAKQKTAGFILAQIVAWSSTLIVIRILDPADYGVFAMTQVILTFLGFLGGYGFASSLIQDREVDARKIRQAFGMLLLINGTLATAQFLAAPLAAQGWA